MARGSLPAQTPVVPQASFLAFDFIYRYLLELDKEISLMQTQGTTSGPSAVFAANAGTAVNDASTFDGYTLGQVIKALRANGTLA